MANIFFLFSVQRQKYYTTKINNQNQGGTRNQINMNNNKKYTSNFEEKFSNLQRKAKLTTKRDH